MKFLKNPPGLIMFAGESLWPQLDALAQWAEHLRRIRIVAAHGETEPGCSAQRLAAFCEDFLPDADTMIVGPVPSDSPMDTQKVVLETASEDMGWLLDVSGGTRMMFTGALLAGRSLPHVHVIFRDPSGPWLELTDDGGTRALQGTDDWAADRFTVEGLLDVTWSDDERNARVLETTVEPEIVAAAAEVLEGEDWKAPFEAAAQEVRRHKPAQLGRLFERFVLSLVRGLGVQADDVTLSAMLYDGNKQLQEVDVVVNSGGRLHVIDCKLLSEEVTPIGAQIREASATRRHLGDDADQYILLRPNMDVEGEFRSLCDAYGIQVIDAQLLAQKSLADVLRELLHPPAESSAGGSGIRPLRLQASAGVVDLNWAFQQLGPGTHVFAHGHILVVGLALGTLSHDQARDAVASALGDDGEVLACSRPAGPPSVAVAVRVFRRADLLAVCRRLTGLDVAQPE